MGDNSSLSDVERPKLGDDIYQHPLRPQMIGTDPQDGLPRVTSSLSMEDTLAPALAPETLVCMGDESAVAIRRGSGGVTSSVGSLGGWLLSPRRSTTLPASRPRCLAERSCGTGWTLSVPSASTTSGC